MIITVSISWILSRWQSFGSQCIVGRGLQFIKSVTGSREH